MSLFTLGFNFDWQLVEALADLSARTGQRGTVSEVFGALAGSPLSSARPTTRIPDATLPTLVAQAAALRAEGIGFNYLMNTSEPIGGKRVVVLDYLANLAENGVDRVTVGTTELARLIKKHLPNMHVTMSITKGVSTLKALDEVARAGCDACYLDGVFVNRNIALLTSLLRHTRLETRLYANMSCVSACPVVRQHYDTFARQNAGTTAAHDGFFAGCSLVKMRSSTEWMQMPWIRPEDISAYAALGVGMFKLTDRLATMPVLVRIAEAYTSATSPPDLFDIIERSGDKYRNLTTDTALAPSGSPYTVDPTAIPDEFIGHFLDGSCISQDKHCPICTRAAKTAVSRNPAWLGFVPSQDVLNSIPAPLGSRAARSSRV